MKKLILRQSIMSGMLVGIGVVINTISDNRYIGAMLFSVALLVIIECGLPLYTGRIGFIRKYKLKELGLTLIGNLIGVTLIPISVFLLRQEKLEIIVNASLSKFNHGIIELLCCGMLCGVLMLTAVYCKKQIITIFCIMIFILSGYEHCIADFPYLLLNFSMMNCLKFLFIVLGNSIGAIFAYELIKPESSKQ